MQLARDAQAEGEQRRVHIILPTPQQRLPVYATHAYAWGGKARQLGGHVWMGKTKEGGGGSLFGVFPHAAPYAGQAIVSTSSFATGRSVRRRRFAADSAKVRTITLGRITSDRVQLFDVIIEANSNMEMQMW